MLSLPRQGMSRRTSGSQATASGGSRKSKQDRKTAMGHVMHAILTHLRRVKQYEEMDGVSAVEQLYVGSFQTEETRGAHVCDSETCGIGPSRPSPMTRRLAPRDGAIADLDDPVTVIEILQDDDASLQPPTCLPRSFPSHSQHKPSRKGKEREGLPPRPHRSRFASKLNFVHSK